MGRVGREAPGVEPRPGTWRSKTAMPGEPAAAAIGATLRDAREARGLSLDAVEQETKIGRALLQAIERGEFRKLPGGIFNRAFIRAYAMQVGLDPAAILTAYERSQGAPPRADRSALPWWPRHDTLAVALGLFLAGLLAAGLWLLWTHLGGH